MNRDNCKAFIYFDFWSLFGRSGFKFYRRRLWFTYLINPMEIQLKKMKIDFFTFCRIHLSSLAPNDQKWKASVGNTWHTPEITADEHPSAKISCRITHSYDQMIKTFSHYYSKKICTEITTSVVDTERTWTMVAPI